MPTFPPRRGRPPPINSLFIVLSVLAGVNFPLGFPLTITTILGTMNVSPHFSVPAFSCLCFSLRSPAFLFPSVVWHMTVRKPSSLGDVILVNVGHLSPGLSRLLSDLFIPFINLGQTPRVFPIVAFSQNFYIHQNNNTTTISRYQALC